MPNYAFKCIMDETEFVKNLPMEERDDANVQCPECGLYFTKRVLRFSGSVWAPTAGGMR